MKTNKIGQLVVEVIVALGISWAAAAVLSGCAVDQAQAYRIIQGVK